MKKYADIINPLTFEFNLKRRIKNVLASKGDDKKKEEQIISIIKNILSSMNINLELYFDKYHK